MALFIMYLFPYEEDGWNVFLKDNDQSKNITECDFYSNQLQVRKDKFNGIMKSRRLMQQYAVDQYAKVEQDRLHFLKTNQKQLKVEKYQGLLDAIANGDMNDVESKIILPPSHTGSPQFYRECFQAGMALVRESGKPDYLITMTTNPK
ncbi:Hypothetical predicted protein [Octopus vulgaris]|uniref:Helitron helicase-like domain-containing protein n=1 Tax=Octopus vulgaris TaxID=6645 RepID=A0AA36AVC8_OCTVU|nr:Hypothetical predicted protein [Octopus vulgaris]